MAKVVIAGHSRFVRSNVRPKIWQASFMMLFLMAALATAGCGASDAELKRAASNVESSFRGSYDAASEFKAYEELLSATQEHSELTYAVALFTAQGGNSISNDEAFRILRSDDASLGVLVEIRILRAPFFSTSTTLLTFKHRLIDERTLIGLLSGH